MDTLWFMLDVISITAVVVVILLVFLILFEPGLYYRVAAPVHKLTQVEQLYLLQNLLGSRPTEADTVAVLATGRDFYPAQLAAIAAAQRTIHLEAYIFKPGRSADAFIAALTERARAGVRVRMIIDAIGSRKVTRRMLAELRAAGIQIHRYHAPRWYTVRRLNNRTHRNLLILDGCVGFIGGAGVADDWDRPSPPPWRDTVVRTSGEMVSGLQTVFAENWLECTGELLASEDNFPRDVLAHARRFTNGFVADLPGPVTGLVVGSTPTSGRSNQARVLIQYLLAAASSRIVICSPYFIPDRGIRTELLAARRRGVSVEIVAGGPHTDHHLVRRAGRKRFGPLLKAGVSIHEYASGMLHAKILLVDDRWAVVGTTNFDHRSFGINDEVNVLFVNEELVQRLTDDFEADVAASEPFSYADWQSRSLRERLLAWLGTALERHQ